MVVLTFYLALKTSVMVLGTGVLGLLGMLSEGVAGPGSSTMPLTLMTSQQLSHEQQMKTEDWAEDCVVTARRNLESRGVEQTFADSVPFPGSAVGHELGVIKSRGMVNCGGLGQEIVDSVVEGLNRVRTPSGVLMAAMWRDELGLTAEDITRFLVQREVHKQLGLLGHRAIPPLKEAGATGIGDRQ